MVELIVTLAVAAILVSVALPSMRDLSGGGRGLFAVDATPPSALVSSNRQPIKGQPDIILHPTQSAYSTRPNTLVFFGTGQYLTQADLGNTQPQTFYGVWDSNTGNLDRGSLQAQTISTSSDAVLGNVRTIPSNPVNYYSITGGGCAGGGDIPGRRQSLEEGATAHFRLHRSGRRVQPRRRYAGGRGHGVPRQ